MLAHDPLLTDDEIRRSGAEPWTWGTVAPGVRALITQTADPRWRDLASAWLPDLEFVLDGRNSLTGVTWPASITSRGIGTP